MKALIVDENKYRAVAKHARKGVKKAVKLNEKRHGGYSNVICNMF